MLTILDLVSFFFKKREREKSIFSSWGQKCHSFFKCPLLPFFFLSHRNGDRCCVEKTLLLLWMVYIRRDSQAKDKSQNVQTKEKETCLFATKSQLVSLQTRKLTLNGSCLESLHLHYRHRHRQTDGHQQNCLSQSQVLKEEEGKEVGSVNIFDLFVSLFSSAIYYPPALVGR